MSTQPRNPVSPPQSGAATPVLPPVAGPPVYPPSVTSSVASSGLSLSSDMLNMYPVQLSEEDLYAPTVTECEGVLPPEEVKIYWAALYNAWGVTDPVTQSRLVPAVLRYFIKNRTSSRTVSVRSIHANGRRFAAKVMYGVLGRDVRRFCRAQADVARLIMRNDRSFAHEVASSCGIFENQELAFDFADACKNLTVGERKTVADYKRNVVQHATPYTTMVDTTTGTGDGSVGRRNTIHLGGSYAY